MASSFEVTEQQQEQSSAMISCIRSELKEFTQKITDLDENIEKLEYKVLQIEKQVPTVFFIILAGRC